MVEIIPKEAPTIPKWLNILFYFSLVLLISALFSYFSLNNSLNKSKEKLSELEIILMKNQTATERISLEREILNYKNKIEIFSSLIDQHLLDSKIFDTLEKIIHPKVWFSSFGLDAFQGLLELSGEAQDFESLDQQLNILKEEKIFDKVVLNSISITEKRKINFSLSLSFYPGILRQK